MELSCGSGVRMIIVCAYALILDVCLLTFVCALFFCVCAYYVQVCACVL
jgi:hypothetical protein